MKSVSFSRVQFIKSALKHSDFPQFSTRNRAFPELAIVGRSNVGKSSLINYLLNNHKTAKVSATPGKTQLLNFFSIEDELILVDLPGYGYSRVSKATKNNWATCIDDYFEKRSDLSGILQLIDIRRIPSDEDLALMNWCKFNNKPFLVIFTKSDKVNLSEKNRNIASSLTRIAETGATPYDHIDCSVKEHQSRKNLIRKINDFISKVK